MGYLRLTRDERYQIQALTTSGMGIQGIGRQLKRSASTISREIKKGHLSSGGYGAFSSHQLTLRHRHRRRVDLHSIRGELETEIRGKLELDWSPEQIAGRMRLNGRSDQVSLQAIYRHVARDKVDGGKLWRHLRILRVLRKKKTGLDWKPRQYLADRVNIDQRPQIVEERSRLGDYERDTVLGKRGKSVLLTIVDRTSRRLKLAWATANTCDEIHAKTVGLLKGEILHTITNDNGFEFLRHKQTAEALGVKIYFANRYRSWERGTNENTNGLLRQYFPKKKDIGRSTKGEIEAVAERLNSRPRKTLGFNTPNEIHRLLRTGGVALVI